MKGLIYYRINYDNKKPGVPGHLILLSFVANLRFQP